MAKKIDEDDEGPTHLVDAKGVPLSEGDPKGPPVAAKSEPDKRLRDREGKLLSDDPKGPPVEARAGGFKKKTRRELMYGKDD